MDYDAQQSVEIVPGLILGSIFNLEEILYMKPDVLFPLDRLPGWIWSFGYRGEIVYYPITDYNILPDDMLDQLVDTLVGKLREGKRVALFCVGGHGRTGYVASCVLHILGTKRPISFLRDKYSFKAVGDYGTGARHRALSKAPSGGGAVAVRRGGWRGARLALSVTEQG